MKRQSGNSRAFTLIELLVVVAIMGVLASVVFAALSSAREKGRIARAKIEVDQIIKAAELAFSDFGYYPNDSHGSIICPKDIVVNLSSGATWGSYISICNDPWGNPYEWNNQCAGAGTRLPNPPYDPACPSYSDASSGPIGVTVVGQNGVNNGCTGDDICSGTRGHPVYGYDNQIITAGPMCTTTVSSCSGLTSLGCLTRSGCSLGPSGCSGTYNNTCTGFSSQPSCTAQTGCSWSGGCAGTPSACSTYGTSGACSAVSGCSWAPAACAGTVNCYVYNNTSQNTCINRLCTWNAGNSTCSGAPNCSPFNTTQCPNADGCNVTSANCGGTPSACSTYGTSGSCSAVTGCSWTAQSCTGTYGENCTVFPDQPSCQTQGSCSWGSGACTGTAVSCSTLPDQNSCNSQSGCWWQ